MMENATMTQKKIITVAKKLFADKGFEGTSIREIAKKAQVNVASINYYFKSKNNLYTFIIHEACHLLSTRAQLIYEEHLKKNEPVEEFFVAIFKDFLQYEDQITSNMKMLMSTHHDEELALEISGANRFGPPGGQIFATAILDSLKKEISPKNLHWAVKSLFAHMTHITIVNKCYLKKCEKSQALPFSSKKDLEDGVRKLATLIIKSL